MWGYIGEWHMKREIELQALETKIVQVDLHSLESVGRVISDDQSNGLFISASNQNGRFHQFEQPIDSYVKLPGRYKLPLQITMTVKVSIPGLYLVLGNGHTSFGTLKDNRSLGDLLSPDCSKPKSFKNSIKLGQNTNITIIYGLQFMQIVIDGETRYLSKKENYMRHDEFAEINKAGFEIKLASDKQAKILINEMSILEYDHDPDIIPYENTIVPAILANSKDVKVDFEECISCLSKEIQDELHKTDQYLLSEKALNVKRKIEGDHLGCKITYVSSLGFSYSLSISEDLMDHFFWWYMVSNYKYENKYMGRKNDLTDETLKYVHNESPEIALRLVSYFDHCCGCSTDCHTKTIYEHDGRKYPVCHGKMIMNMDTQTFSDMRFMFDGLQKVLSSDLIKKE
jgi:hypothetical protein